MDIKAQRNNRLNSLRKLIEKENLFGYIVPSWDEYSAGECSKDSKRLEYVTGFSGSNGIGIITLDQVLLITDGRYIAQAEIELSGIKHLVINQRETDYGTYFSANAIIGYDSRLFSKKQIALLNGVNCLKITENLVDKIWPDRLQRSHSRYFAYSATYSGISTSEKISLCLNFIRQNEANYWLIHDSIVVNWILNIRARDLDHTPIVLSRAIIGKGKLLLFVRDTQSLAYLEEWQELVEVFKEESFEQFIKDLEPSKIIISSKSIPLYFVDLLSQKHQITELEGPIELEKACKRERELEWTKLRHAEDGAALCEAFSELLELFHLGNKLREYDVTQLLIKYRRLNKGYVCESFAAICGFRANGAIIHYRPDSENSEILSNGMILIDSGGHYLGGTTDVTRNLILGGKPTQEQRVNYTLVLKGHIALALACFPKGTTGKHLDVLARQFLRHNGYDYPHGTGHGVGNCLSVHEGPQSISPSGNVVLLPGMIFSNEPGYYKEGEYGIRIENLCFVKESDLFRGFLCFEQLTLVPYCSALIDFSMLSSQEGLFLKSYYEEIKKSVVPLLSKRAKKWCIEEIDFLLNNLLS